MKHSVSKVLLNELLAWMEAIVSSTPGFTGSIFRRWWFSKRFKHSERLHIGRGCQFIAPSLMGFKGKTMIADHCYFNADGGSIDIGNWAAFNNGVHINAAGGGKISIGDHCLIGPGVVMRTANHQFDRSDVNIQEQGHEPADITIEDNCWIGANVVILGGVCIGNGAVIGAGAVVTKDIPSLALAVGVPAKLIRYRAKDAREMKKTCPICQGTDVKENVEYRNLHSTFAGLKRVHCSICSMVFAAPMPSEQALNDYNADYFSTAHAGQPHAIGANAFFSGMSRLRIAHIERYLEAQGANVLSVLELGPGTGFFARNWLEKHPKTDYMAYETDITCYATLQKSGVKLIDSLANAEELRPVDLVVMSHVLEHVSEPVRFLTETTQSLRNNGVLFIEVPCRDYEHKSMDEPHLLFFDKKPLHHLLSQLGFNNIQLSYHGEELSKLRSFSLLRATLSRIRSKLIVWGVVMPFARVRPGMEALTVALERAVVTPFKVEKESIAPARWLRAVATKCE